MSIKDKLTTILFGKKTEEPEEQESRIQAAQAEEGVPETLPFAAEDPALLKLPGDHPLQQLYALRRAGCPRPG